MSEPVLLEEIRDSVALLTLNRADRLNAINGELMEALLEATRRLAADDTVRAVLLAGAGRAFCSGGDIREGDRRRDAQGAPARKPEFDEQVWSRYSRMQTARYLQEMPKPTIAMIRGAAVGAGLSLSLACDFRIASETAVLRSAFASAGLSGDYGIGQSLTRLVGRARAAQVLMLSEKIDATAGLQLGLLTRVITDDRLEEETWSFVRQLATGPTFAYGRIKANLANAHLPPEQYLLEEVRNQTRCHQTDDVREAGRAFVDKRAPQFKGR